MLSLPHPAPSGITDLLGRPIAAGVALHLRTWPLINRKPTGLEGCYLWRVEEGAGGRLMLVAYGTQKRLLLTPTRAEHCIVYAPATDVALSEYPVEWARWIASGWGLYVSEANDGYYISMHQGGASNGGLIRRSGSGYNSEPAAVRFRLMEALYWTKHRPTALKQSKANGGEVPQEVIEGFVRQMEQREAKGLSSFPDKRGRSRVD